MMRLLPHALLLLLVSASATSAENAEILRMEGRAARLTGQFDDAVLKLGEAAQSEPDNADIQVELGLTLAGLKRYAEAAAAFRRALERAPGYTDAELGLARLEYFQGHFAQARAMAIQLAEREPESEAAALVAQIDKAIDAENAAIRAQELRKAGKASAPRKGTQALPPRPAMRPVARIDLSGGLDLSPPSTPATRWRIDLDGSRSTLSGNRPTWLEATSRLGYEIRPGTTLSGGIQEAKRYGKDDTSLDARLDRKLSPSTSFYLQGGGTPDADFLAKWSLGAGGAVRLYQQAGLFAATMLTLDARTAEYTTGATQTYSTGLEQYLMGGRLWLTLRWIHLVDADGGHHNGGLARADVIVNDRLRVFAGYANAPETDEGLTVDTSSMFGGVICGLREHTDLKVSFAHEEREGRFDLNSVSTGVTYRF